MPPLRHPDVPSAAPGGTSDLSRAIVTVAIGVYLVGLVLAILGNSSSNTSAVVRTVKGRLFAPWLVPAWLDVGHDHHLTYGLAQDADHAVELRATGTDRVLHLPGRLRGERAARWRRLAAAAAPTGEGDEAAVAVMAAVGAGSFDDLATEDVTVRVLRRPLPERRAMPIPQGFQQASSARVRRVGGEVQLIMAAPAGELAPLAAPTPAAGTGAAAP